MIWLAMNPVSGAVGWMWSAGTGPTPALVVRFHGDGLRHRMQAAAEFVDELRQLRQLRRQASGLAVHFADAGLGEVSRRDGGQRGHGLDDAPGFSELTHGLP